MLRLVIAALVLVGAPPAQAQTPPAPAPAAPAQPTEPPANVAPPAESAPAQPAPAPGLELPPPPDGKGGASQGGNQDLSLEEWNPNKDWSLVEPKVALFELAGYFRLRGDLFRNLDFGNDTGTEIDSTGQSRMRYPPLDDGEANFTSTNMRLRVEPTINVTEDIHLVTTIDIFDNLVMGSTANSPLDDKNAPINILSTSQAKVSKGVNSISDSIVVKRAYARVTALNEQLELRFGRMPSQWGLGMFDNSGDCLNCDFGNVADRIALTFKIADHLFTPMYDWASSGPVLTPFGTALGGPVIDAVTWDDIDQYSLRIQRLDAPADIAERVSEGGKVLNYGIWGVWRRQLRDLPLAYYDNTDTPYQVTVGSPSTNAIGSGERRNSNIVMGDGYLRLHVGEFVLAAEGAITYGTFRYRSLAGAGDETGTANTTETNTIITYGGALDGSWHLGGAQKGTTLRLMSGIASGDPRKGFHALDFLGTDRGLTASGGHDVKFESFQYSPDYQVDLLLFRTIIGTVTDAWYVHPEVSYLFDNNVGGRLWAVYSQAMRKSSTQGDALPLGLEFDAELSYGLGQMADMAAGAGEPSDRGAFKALIAGGILVPFGAFKNPALDDKGGSLAWTLQARLYVTF